MKKEFPNLNRIWYRINIVYVFYHSLMFYLFLLTFREIPTTDTILCCKNREIRHSFSATACRNQKHRQVINRFYDGTVSIIVLILDPKPLRFLVKILQKRVPAEARVRAGCNFLISSWIFLTLVKHSPPYL